MVVSGATMQNGAGSRSTTLNSTARMAARATKRSPLWSGRYASRKYGLRKVSKRSPVRPSTVSSIGSTWIRLPYSTLGHGRTETMSPSRTRRLVLITRFMRILSSGQASSARTMPIVSRWRRPLRVTVSPRKRSSSSILAWLSETTELSSAAASSTRSRHGLFFVRRMAVATSSSTFSSSAGAPLIADSRRASQGLCGLKVWRQVSTIRRPAPATP
mmetsp:Transcript_31506/g.94671  ORF Transcript_31506/g.94671 Transcript_31506/m.94671 type:complete len:216 (+) Transcript_31506:7021-7668(+)